MNNSEYFYIRNAQSDIIGILDSNGNKIASYNYDTFGKLISIDGDKELGEKNPYRYRGYRYDNETGFYYLQTRYYNPQWGRFLNADSIGGSVGEVLSHNIFAYCKNDFVNAKDPSGLRPIYTVSGEETEAMREASYRAMHEFYIWKETTKNNQVSLPRGYPTVNQARGICVGGMVGAADSLIDNAIKQIPDYVPLAMNRQFARHGGAFFIPVKGASSIKALGKVGVVGSLMTLVSVGSDLYKYGFTSEGLGRAAIDLGAAVASVAFGMALPGVGGIVGGMVIGAASVVVKNILFGYD